MGRARSGTNQYELLLSMLAARPACQHERAAGRAAAAPRERPLCQYLHLFFAEPGGSSGSSAAGHACGESGWLPPP
jgi:hypothetical protein